MSLIKRMRKQNAIYWPPAAPDAFGRLTVGPLVELVQGDNGNLRVRWEDVAKEYTTADGTTRVSEALVYVPQLPGTPPTELQLGGWLWLGDRVDVQDEEDPRASGAAEIKRLDKLPNLRGSEYLRTAYL